MKSLPYMLFLCMVILFVVYRMINFLNQHAEVYQSAEMETQSHPFETTMGSEETPARVGYLPRGIIHSISDLEVKPLWFRGSSELKDTDQNHRNLLAISVGIRQRRSVDEIVRKFLPENFTVILFHYDGNVNGWYDLQWSNSAIHIAAQNQTKWWFAKRFLHPDVVSIYDYIFLWDEDLGVDNFHPGRYLNIVRSEELEISQPALDPDHSEIHHQITVRRRKGKFHKRVYDARGNRKCSSASKGPPCTGWVEGMAPVFSRSAWRCAWHLIQNDLIHGWGMDMKLGYCVQGDRTQKVGIIDSEYIVHQGVQTLGESLKEKSRRSGVRDARIEVRRQAKSELQNFQERWDRAVSEDKGWVDPYPLSSRKHSRHGRHH